MFVSYYTVCFSFKKKIYSKRSHDRCINSVFCCRASSTLHMTKNSSTCLHTRLFFDSLCHIHRITDTFGIDDNVMLFTAFSAFFDVCNDLCFIVVMFLRKKNLLCSIGNTAPQCKVSRITSHNFDNTTSFMWCRCITYFVNCFHRCINRCIESDCVFCTCDIKIDRSRKSDCIYSKIR